MEVSIDGKVYPFHGGELEVNLKLAEQIKRHHLYKKSHIFSEEDAIVVNGKVQALKDDPTMKDLTDKAKNNKNLTIFSFPSRPSITVDAGPHKIIFHDNKVALEKDEADCLRRHMFFRQGKIVELEVLNG
tara:strand:- start:5592 stop:5981 length:390 start_codon:yes stop_codon:yes gene_type:complete